MADGRIFEILYPRMCLVTRTDVAIGFPEKDCPDVASHVIFVNPEDIIRFEPLPEPVAPKESNGKPNL